MWDVVLDAFLDTLKLFPFLFVLYILIEFLEHMTAIGKPNGVLSGKCAPLVGGATGLVPLCGFSVMAAKLYEKRYLTLGTLLAVFIATSDEAILILIPAAMPWLQKLTAISALLLSKLVLGVGVGYAADAIFGRRGRKSPLYEPSEPHEHDCAHEHMHEDAHEGEAGELSACEHKHNGKINLYLVSPLLHALQVSAFVLFVNFAFGTLFYFAGEDNVTAFLQAGQWYQPLISALVGLIPNCASSVVIAETYVMGGITFGSLLAGLTVNAGLGYIVLFRNTKEWKRNLLIVAALFLIGVAAGYIVDAVALAI